MKSLPDVTLISYDGNPVDRTVRVLNHCLSLFKFGAVKFWTDKPEDARSIANKQIEIITVPKATKISCGNWLVNGIDFKTSHCLLVNWDGWIINPGVWDDSWLQYDYIGCPWPSEWIGNYILGPNRVGGEGFSLQSKKFIDACRMASNFFREDIATDVWKCQHMYWAFTNIGIKYAPVEVAGKFGWECPIEERTANDHSFGFHGTHKGFSL